MQPLACPLGVFLLGAHDRAMFPCISVMLDSLLSQRSSDWPVACLVVLASTGACRGAKANHLYVCCPEDSTLLFSCSTGRQIHSLLPDPSITDTAATVYLAHAACIPAPRKKKGQRHGQLRPISESPKSVPANALPVLRFEAVMQCMEVTSAILLMCDRHP